ncbi:hypothetical protein SRRS_07170 [Sporomusa rhizae]|uniref:hypothetical protein n=1 Tax=Sporomusa rhizae TaxID=357999 RepID=UPI00352B2E9E
MIAYFDPFEVRDKLLKGLIKQEDIADSTQYIEDLALRLDVDPARIPVPAPYQIKMLAMCYALMSIALNASMNNGAGGENEADAYELKRRIYAKRVAELESQVTAKTLLGGGSQKMKYPVSIPLGRC